MSFTGQLGTSLSQPGQILLGSIGSAPLNITVSDNLDNWNDSTARQLGYFLQPSDTLTFTDSIRVVLGLHLNANDNLDNWLDEVTTRIIGFLRLTLSDSLNNWDDAIALFKENTATPQLIYKPNEVEYIRRYLNDVVIENLGSYSFPAQVVYKPNEIIYLRRYLNDV